MDLLLFWIFHGNDRTSLALKKTRIASSAILYILRHGFSNICSPFFGDCLEAFRIRLPLENTPNSSADLLFVWCPPPFCLKHALLSAPHYLLRSFTFVGSFLAMLHVLGSSCKAPGLLSADLPWTCFSRIQPRFLSFGMVLFAKSGNSPSRFPYATTRYWTTRALPSPISFWHLLLNPNPLLQAKILVICRCVCVPYDLGRDHSGFFARNFWMSDRAVKESTKPARRFI